MQKKLLQARVCGAGVPPVLLLHQNTSPAEAHTMLQAEAAADSSQSPWRNSEGPPANPPFPDWLQVAVEAGHLSRVEAGCNIAGY